MRKCFDREEGFTLIEVLAATVILSIVSLSMTAFFVHAMAYNKGNQNKTVMVNLARNALFYMEKQNFDTWHKIFITDGHTVIYPNFCVEHADVCSKPEGDKPKAVKKEGDHIEVDYYALLEGSPLQTVIHPNVNGVLYQIKVEFQQEIIDNMDNDSAQKGMADYLIPIKVTVSLDDPDHINGRNIPVSVEGYIADESIR